MKKLFTLSIMVVTATTFMSCQLMDSLFFNAEAVKADELTSFSGSTPTSKSEALASVLAGLSTSAMPVIDSMTSTAASPDLLRAVFSKVPGAAEVYARSISATKAIATTDTVENFIENVQTTGNGSLKLTMTDEDFDTDLVTVNGSIDMEVSGFLPTSRSASASLQADITTDINGISNSAFNGGKLNFKMDIESTASISSQEVDNVTGYAAMALNAGFSLDETQYNKAGKYLISLKFTSRYNVDISDTYPANDVEAEIHLKVYNGANKLVGDYTYTDDEIATSFSGLMN